MGVSSSGKAVREAEAEKAVKERKAGKGASEHLVVVDGDDDGDILKLRLRQVVQVRLLEHGVDLAPAHARLALELLVPRGVHHDDLHVRVCAQRPFGISGSVSLFLIFFYTS